MFGEWQFGVNPFGQIYISISYDRTGNLRLIQAQMNPAYGDIEIVKPIGKLEMRKNEWP